MVKLIMLIGLPSSGKSTFAKEWANKEDCVIISSDAIRKELYGSEEVQENPNKVFNLMFERTVEGLASGNTVFYDATNISRKYRVAFLDSLSAALQKRNVNFPIKKIAYVFATPYEVCLETNKARSRVVPDNVITRMYKSFQMPSLSEGFDYIDVYARKQNPDMLLSLLKAARYVSHDNPHHSLSIGEHCLKASSYIYEYRHEIKEQLGLNAWLIISNAVLFHDIGKPFCKTFTKPNGVIDNKAHFYGHECVGAYDYLCYSTSKFAVEVALLINLHMLKYHDPKHQEKMRSIYGDYIWEMLEWVNKADMAAH